MHRSYLKKAFPWDNACIESFHSILKREWLTRYNNKFNRFLKKATLKYPAADIDEVHL